jgi:hypothetical protein
MGRDAQAAGRHGSPASCNWAFSPLHALTGQVDTNDLTLASGWVKVRRVISEIRHFPRLQIVLGFVVSVSQFEPDIAEPRPYL